MIKDKIRTLLNIRVKREAQPSGPKPKAGRRITLGRIRMQVTSPPPDDLWFFLTVHGWREVTIGRDRRRYSELPRNSLDLLAHCPGNDRELLYQRLLAKAKAAAPAQSGGKALGSKAPGVPGAAERSGNRPGRTRAA